MKKFFLFIFIILVQSVFARENVRFKFVKNNVSLQPGGSAQVSVRVYLPKDNHLYLKKLNSLSFNIPTTFSVRKKNGWSVEVAQFPQGSRKKKNDLILQGKGSRQVAGVYQLEVFETLGKTGKTRIPIEILTQVCNSKTNTCFRPQKFARFITARVSGHKRVHFGARSNQQNISWETSYDQAFRKARSNGKNVFVVITAPDWCGYCIQLERNVFSKTRVHALLNEKFIPLRILDSSPDLQKFNFRGFPTMYVMNSSKKILTRSIGRRESSFLASLSPFASSDTGESEDAKQVHSFSINIKGKFVRKGKKWLQKIGEKDNLVYKEIRRDKNYVILWNQKTREHIAFPLNSKQGFVYRDKKWQPYFQLDK